MTGKHKSRATASTAILRRQWDDICGQLQAALAILEVCSVSIYDEQGEMLRMTSRVPNQERAVLSAFTRFRRRSLCKVYVFPLGAYRERERSAIVIPVVHAGERLVGAAMVVLDTATLRDNARLVSDSLAAPAVAQALRDFAMRRAIELPVVDNASDTQLRRSPSAKLELMLEIDNSNTRKLRRLSISAEPVSPPHGNVREPARPVPRPVRTADLEPLPDPLAGLAPDPARRDAQPFKLFVQRLMPLRDDLQSSRCEVLWLTPDGKDPLRSHEPRIGGAGSLLERRVLIELCRWVRDQPQTGRSHMPRLWLKLSAQAFADATFLNFVGECLPRAGFPPDRLGFEVPAELASANPADAADFTRALTGQGCFLVLDNFTMRDEHVELLALPNLRMIKLEPAMATQMRSDRWLQQKVANVGQSTRAMGLKMVVKRMPTRQEALWFRDYGVDFAQSQALTPALPLARFTASGS